MVVLVLFMVLTAIALERAVVKRALQAHEDGLQLLTYNLLAAVDQDDLGRSITVSDERLFEPDLLTRNSGLYALLYDAEQRQIWGSKSLTVSLPKMAELEVGIWNFESVEHLGRSYFRLGFAIQWPDVDLQLRNYQVAVWREASNHFEQLNRFRQTLWTWLIVTTCLLLIIMYAVMRWSLRPLHQVGLEVKAIEDQRQIGFEKSYPTEIEPLTENLNILLKREQLQRQRYRNAMDDLAHSLKTPLAVLVGLGDQTDLQGSQLQTLRDQVERMDQIVSYQLQRASSLGDVRMAKPVSLQLIVNQLLQALKKVYRDKNLNVEVDLLPSMLLRIDQGDCLEVVGNLLDNAFKFARQQVSLNASCDSAGAAVLRIDDDGKGLAEDQIQHILTRGMRLDESTEGQGIGLAVVADIVKSYNIEMAFSPSALGGLCVSLKFQSV